MDSSHNVALASITDVALIVQACGSEVNVTALPDTCHCPCCGTHSLVAHADNITCVWFSCRVCSFNGDAIRLYMSATNKNLDECLTSLLSNKIISAQPSPKSMLDYRVLMQQQAVINQWVTSAFDRDDVINRVASSDHTHTLMREFGYSNIDELLNSQYDALGLITLSELSLDQLGDNGLPFPGKPHRPYFIAPMYSSPGCVSGLMGFDKRAAGVSHRDYAFPMSHGDSGLAFVTGEMLDASVVYTTRLGDFASLFHADCSRRGHIRPPVTLFGGSSTSALHMFRRQKIVFFDSLLSVELFIAAKEHAASAIISLIPDVDDPRSLWDGMLPSDYLAVIYNNGLPYYTALTRFLESLGSAARISTLTKLKLDTVQAQSLLGAVSDSGLRDELSQILKLAMPEHTIATNSGKHIVVSGDQFHLRDKAGHMTFIGGAVPVIEKLTMHGDDAYYIGKVHVAGLAYRFRVCSTEFNTAWLTKFCQAKGHAVSFAAPLTRSLEHICLQLHRPSMTDEAGELGPTPEGYVFPRVTVRTDGTVSEQITDVGIAHPANIFNATHKRPYRAAVQEWLSADNVDIALAVYAVVAMKLIAPDNSPVLLSVGGVLDSGAIGKLATDFLGLEVHHMSKNAMQDIATSAAMFNLPVVIPCRDGTAIAGLRALDRLQPIVVGDASIEATARLDGRWWIVDCSGAASISGETTFLSMFAESVKYAVEIRASERPYAEILRIWRKHVHKVYGIEPSKFGPMDRAEARFKSAPSTASSLGARFLHTVRFLLDAEAMYATFSVTAEPVSRNHIVITDDEVYISLKHVRSFFATAKLPYPGDEALLSSMFEDKGLVREVSALSSPGAVISRRYWDKHTEPIA